MKRKRNIFSLILLLSGAGLLLSSSGCVKNCCNQLNPTTRPYLTTDSVTAITQTTAKCGGIITYDGGAPVTARGVCWNTSQSPTITNDTTLNGNGIGSFTSSITGLIPDTVYFVRAFAINSAGTAYGNERIFVTLAATGIPTLTTVQVTNITQTIATSGGTITSAGTQPVTARGVCWNTTPNPTTANSKTTDGSGTGGFTSSITGLIANTTYYVRAYATNSVGTAYGNQQTFSTLTIQGVPALTTVQVINITQTTATCGGTITSDGGSPVTARGVCWNTLPNPTTANSKTSDGSGTGGFTSSITGLTANTTYYVRAYATNSVGSAYGNQQTFSTLPVLVIPVLTTARVINIAQTTATSGGTITSDGGSPVTARGVCWRTSPNPTTADSKTSNGIGTGSFVSNLTSLTAGTPYYLKAYATNSVGTSYGNEVTFTTLPNITVPTLTTTTPSNITQISFTSGGDVSSDGGAPVTARGVCWSIANNPTLADLHTSDGTGTGIFVSQISNLLPGTLYYVRAYATNSAGTAYGNQVTCTTVADGTPCPGMPTFTYGGQVYNTVQIGTQCWMKENLNIGTRIDGSQDQTNNGIIEKYCYNDDDNNCTTYGGLYQWHEIMQYVTTEGTQGICPSGWHMPTNTEWVTLTNYLGGESVAGGKMKEAGYSHWLSPNTGATNQTGFTALPSGANVGYPFYNGLNSYTYISSSSMDNPSGFGIDRDLDYQNAGAYYQGTDNHIGVSVRCVKN